MNLRVRAARKQDQAEVMSLAKIAGVGMSSLPQDDGVMATKIENSLKSFAGNPVHPQEEGFLFVLEDIKSKRLVGTTGVVAHVGLSRPFYSYKVSTISQASSEIEAYSLQNVLHMVNDYTGVSEIGSLFLHPDYRRDGIGSFLSRSRYLLLAEFEHLFSEVVISEIRGVQEEDGSSPFYDNLARHFFKMEFSKADYIYATKGGQFIADLMPKYPIYVNLLPKVAQEVIGVPFAASEPALKLLRAEGFSYEGYVDLFDAGPTLQAKRSNLRTVRDSAKSKVIAISPIHAEQYIICNTRLADFTITRASLEKKDGGVVITPEAADALNVKIGDMVRYVV